MRRHVEREGAGTPERPEESPLVTHLAAEQVEHLEAEGATVNKRPDGTALVTTFVAGGVEMTGRTK